MLAKMREFKELMERAGLTVKIDDRDNLRSGFKYAEWELKGVPVRIAMGPRDLENRTAEVVRRDTLEKEFVNWDSLVEHVAALMEQIQQNIYKKALDFRNANTYKVDSWDEFKQNIKRKIEQISEEQKIEEGGFLLCHWDGTKETEAKIQEETKATIRCIPIDSFVCEEEGKCVYSGKPSKRRVIFAKSY